MMKVRLFMDGILCTGEVKLFNVIHGIISIWCHPKDCGNWKFIKVYNIKGNLMYENSKNKYWMKELNHLTFYDNHKCISSLNKIF